jgi:hypothetical protein
LRVLVKADTLATIKKDDGADKEALVDEKKSSVPINETLAPRMESSGFGPRSIHLGPRIQWIPARSIHLAAGSHWILARIQWI